MWIWNIQQSITLSFKIYKIINSHICNSCLTLSLNIAFVANTSLRYVYLRLLHLINGTWSRGTQNRRHMLEYAMMPMWETDNDIDTLILVMTTAAIKGVNLISCKHMDVKLIETRKNIISYYCNIRKLSLNGRQLWVNKYTRQLESTY